MSSLAIGMQTTSASFAMGDEWEGVTPLMPEAAAQGSAYQVGKVFGRVGAQGAVGLDGQALVMAAGASGPASKLATWQTLSYPQLNAAMLAACRSTLQRKRLACDRVVLATSGEAGDAATTWDVLALRSAGFAAPLCIPRALACAAAMPAREAPLAVIDIGFDDVWVSQVRHEGTAVDSALVTRKSGIGVSAIWRPLLEQLEDRFCASMPNANLARCEAVEFARALIAHSLNSHGALTPLPRLREERGLMSLEAVFACDLRHRMERWCREIGDAIAPALGSYGQAVVTVEDCGVAGLSQFVIAQMQPQLACELSLGIDAAQGAARISASGIPLEALSQRHARLSQFRDMAWGVLRPDGAGGASFHALGQVGQLTAPQKLSLKTTREDQARMVLPLGLCAPNAPPQMLGILEFPLSAPAKKGVLVEFYIELADPLIRVCGIEEQGISPVGEVFVPLDPSLAQEAASLREFVSTMGAVY